MDCQGKTHTLKTLEQVRGKLSEARSISVLTGAGISKPSGIPTFRGKDGLWRSCRAEDLATMEAFLRNPRLVWDWYLYRRKLISSCSPNPAHYALVEIEIKVNDFLLITQNVDGLHKMAGSKKMVELHGNIFTSKCLNCGFVREDFSLEYEEMPLCKKCGGMERPGVVWFGETLPEGAMESAAASASACDVFLVIGTSGVVQPAASLAVLARSSGAFVVEINFEKTPLSEVADITLTGDAAEILPLVVGDNL